MLRSKRFGYLLIVVGVVLVLHRLRFGFTTQLYCSGTDSLLYEVFRILPSRAEITYVSFKEMTLVWDDGCNRRGNSLVLIMSGLATSIAGIAIVRLDRFRDAEP